MCGQLGDLVSRAPARFYIVVSDGRLQWEHHTCQREFADIQHAR